MSVVGPALAQDAAASALCTALSRSVHQTEPGRGPVFVASYQAGPDETAVPAALRSSAFAYDNALAIMALVACGEVDQARRIGDAFLLALDNDRTFKDGRIRNAYRAGPVRAGPVLLPGWWDASANHWAEDRYQDGTATGNVAWVGLALLTLDDAVHEPRYRAGARRLADWVQANATDRSAAGFTGGRDGFDPEQTALTWKSTEHNIDIVALGTWLNDPPYVAMATSARAFVDAAFDGAAGCFRMGTTPEGRMRGVDAVALDTQLWPLLGVLDPPPAWRGALACAQDRLGVAGGFDFNDDRDGLWVEGTAQASLTYAVVGETGRASALLAAAMGERAPSGWLYATREPQVTTGLQIGPGSTTADFLYYRRPHLGATAWAALAAQGWNPFTGRRAR